MSVSALRFAGPAVAAAALAFAFMPTHALADASHIPATLYPPRTHITQISPLTNHGMDCDWGFACHDGQPVTAAPVFHLRTQDDLHRMSGWAQFGDTGKHAGRMLFALFASRYAPDSADGLPWNVLAFSDFRGTLLAGGFHDIDRVLQLAPQGEIGNASEQVAQSSDGDVLAMACWTGSIEVEGVAIYAHGSASAHRLAVRDLTRQIRAATQRLDSDSG